jgi:NADPH:quinone reductase-like Zn-dependent oxidoreductase
MAMRAIVYTRYGSPDVLALREIDPPVAGDGQVLVRVRASSLNVADKYFMRGMPYVMRLMTGLTRPRNRIPGLDLAGEVEAVGEGVTRFREGDEVYGQIEFGGCLAELVAVPETAIGPKPVNLTFEEAAAVPLAAMTALQGLRDQGRIESGQKVLINGASGAVGTFAVQIAKAFCAEVTGVCSTRNVDLVLSLGADRVVDYTREDFTRTGETYDLMLDNVGNRALTACRRVLAPNAIYLPNGGPPGRWLGPALHMMKSVAWSWIVSQTVAPFVQSAKAEDLDALKGLLEAGTIGPAIDRRYDLDDVPEAMRYLETGHARAKIVITV